jgi:hypothetical protein
MSPELRHSFEYKGITGFLTLRELPRRSIIKFHPEPPNEMINREIMSISLGFLEGWRHAGRFPDLQWAREFAAVLLIGPEVFHDTSQMDPKVLAKTARVTEEFATFRIALARRGQSESQ